MKKIITFFSDSVTANETAMKLANFPDFTGEIVLRSESTESSQAFSCCRESTVFGALFGFIAGIFITFFASITSGTSFFVVAGTVSGAVTGAITGCIVDIFNFENFPYCVGLIISSPEKSLGKLLNFLKKSGARGTFLLTEAKEGISH